LEKGNLNKRDPGTKQEDGKPTSDGKSSTQKDHLCERSHLHLFKKNVNYRKNSSGWDLQLGNDLDLKLYK